MLTTIIEPGVYLVGTKTFKSGQEVPLTEQEQEQFKHFEELYRQWNALRHALVADVYAALEPFDMGMAAKAHQMRAINLDMRHHLNTLVSMIEKRLGGLLPIYYSSATNKLVISSKCEEPLVYTTKMVGDMIGIQAYTFPWWVGEELSKAKVSFDPEIDDKLSVISVVCDPPKDKPLPALTAALETVLKTKSPAVMSLIVLWGKIVRIINTDAIPSTVDPSTRVTAMLKELMIETKPSEVSLVTEKTEAARITINISHINKTELAGAEILHVVGPVRETTVNTSAKANFGPTRMSVEAIRELLK